MGVSFTPPSGIAPFRYWCQHMLPAVYDDSLSYYELLCKMSAKLNEMVANDNVQSDAINELEQWAADIDNRIVEYVKKFIVEDARFKPIVREAVNEYLESLVVGHTYNELKTRGFIHE